MSNYDHTLTLTIPPDLLLVGKSIARALDPDVGGYESFGPVIDGETIVAYTTSTPCTAGFYEQALAMLSAPEMLHYAVTADYAARWADLVPPTLEECQAFCAAVALPVEPEPEPEPSPAPDPELVPQDPPAPPPERKNDVCIAEKNFRPERRPGL